MAQPSRPVFTDFSFQPLLAVPLGRQLRGGVSHPPSPERDPVASPVARQAPVETVDRCGWSLDTAADAAYSGRTEKSFAYQAADPLPPSSRHSSPIIPSSGLSWPRIEGLAAYREASREKIDSLGRCVTPAGHVTAGFRSKSHKTLQIGDFRGNPCATRASR